MSELKPKSHEEPPDDPVLRERLQHVYWIGGGSGAGKSTIARRIAAQHGFRVYSTDDAMPEHARGSTPDESPLLHKFMAMDMDERWLKRDPQTMLETFHWFHGECFNMIVGDLLAMPREQPVIAEGFRLLPRLVKPLLSASNHALWLLPTPEFRQCAVESRWEFLARTSDPEKALRNMIERDRLFTEILREETERLELPCIEVNTTMTEDDLAKRVTQAFSIS